jgi:hypothetical protein
MTLSIVVLRAGFVVNVNERFNKDEYKLYLDKFVEFESLERATIRE